METKKEERINLRQVDIPLSFEETKIVSPMFQNQKGITLVALILTVILLVILSAVGISVVYNSRIIEYAINGTTKYGQEGINENKVLEGTGSLIQSVVDSLKDVSGGDIPDIGEENTAPIFEQSSSVAKEWNSSSKTTSFNITAKANDIDAENTLNYTIYMKLKTEADSEYKIVGTLGNQIPGKEVTIPVSQYNGADLENYTEYNWKVEVTDNIASPVSEGTVNTTQTYCVTTSCPLNSYNYKYCTVCTGHNGKCTTCGGLGKIWKSGTAYYSNDLTNFTFTVSVLRSGTVGGSIGIDCDSCQRHISSGETYWAAIGRCPNHSNYLVRLVLCKSCGDSTRIGKQFTPLSPGSGGVLCMKSISCTTCSEDGKCQTCSRSRLDFENSQMF